MIRKIYKHFGFDQKSSSECNEEIRKIIADYFGIPTQENNEPDEKKILIKDYNDNSRCKGKNDENKKFNKNDFLNDFSTLGRFFWDSSFNFEIEKENNYIDTNLLDININQNDKDGRKKKTEELKNKIFSEELFFEEGKNENDIKQYVKKIFDLGNSNVNLPKKMKMKMKIFFISFISNKVIDQICGEVKEEKGFKYKSIYDFYYNILTTYNKVIIGLKLSKY